MVCGALHLVEKHDRLADKQTQDFLLEIAIAQCVARKMNQIHGMRAVAADGPRTARCIPRA
ncbi:hypothetical protein D1F64_15930 [Breoghania sp. L-A4]|nr:hypothetical protein D1F64_15930 [Breoghania sp. L-A4]